MKEYLIYYKIMYTFNGVGYRMEGNCHIYLYNDIRIEDISNIQKNVLEANRQNLYKELAPENVVIVNIMKLGKPDA